MADIRDQTYERVQDGQETLLNVNAIVLLESFIENNADAIWIIDSEDTLLRVNPAFERLFGWSVEEVPGMRLPIVPEFLRDEMDRIHRSIRSGATIAGMDTIRRHKDGSYLHVEATLSPLRDSSGLIVGITGICRDVTARKRAEDELRIKTEQLESFIENNVDAIAIIGIEGNVLRVNAAFERIFGWTKEEIVGTSIYKLRFFPEGYETELIRMLDELHAGKSIIEETTRLRKDGEELNVTLTVSPILDENERLTSCSVMLRDLTERKVAQELSRNSEKLAIAGQLAAGIAHEIRNPITSIKGFMQLMKSGISDKQWYYDIMSSEIERIELILSELLILAKPQSVKFEEKDVRMLLNHVSTLLESQANLNGVEITTTFKASNPYLYCDENQIKQVFINFMKNAIESMPRGGNLTVEASGDEERTVIRFIDQGSGIPKEILARLGQPFYTTKETGTGLGFMVSKQIIENHSGELRVESVVGQGTTIEVSLPVNR